MLCSPSQCPPGSQGWQIQSSLSRKGQGEVCRGDVSISCHNHSKGPHWKYHEPHSTGLFPLNLEIFLWIFMFFCCNLLPSLWCTAQVWKLPKNFPVVFSPPSHPYPILGNLTTWIAEQVKRDMGRTIPIVQVQWDRTLRHTPAPSSCSSCWEQLPIVQVQWSWETEAQVQWVKTGRHALCALEAPAILDKKPFLPRKGSDHHSLLRVWYTCSLGLCLSKRVPRGFWMLPKYYLILRVAIAEKYWLKSAILQPYK